MALQRSTRSGKYRSTTGANSTRKQPQHHSQAQHQARAPHMYSSTQHSTAQNAQHRMHARTHSHTSTRARTRTCVRARALAHLEANRAVCVERFLDALVRTGLLGRCAAAAPTQGGRKRGCVLRGTGVCRGTEVRNTGRVLIGVRNPGNAGTQVRHTRHIFTELQQTKPPWPRTAQHSTAQHSAQRGSGLRSQAHGAGLFMGADAARLERTSCNGRSLSRAPSRACTAALSALCTKASRPMADRRPTGYHSSVGCWPTVGPQLPGAVTDHAVIRLWTVRRPGALGLRDGLVVLVSTHGTAFGGNARRSAIRLPRVPAESHVARIGQDRRPENNQKPASSLLFTCISRSRGSGRCPSSDRCPRTCISADEANNRK